MSDDRHNRTTELDPESVGPLIQAYARARAYDPPSGERAGDLADALDADLKARIDMLGFDLKRLLEVPPGDALRKLSELEREALLEDAGVLNRVDAARSREERGFHGGADRGGATVVRRHQRTPPRRRR